MKASTSSSKNKNNALLRTLLPIIFWLAVWCVAAFLAGKDLLLPSPVSVIKSFAALAKEPIFWKSTLYSLVRIFAGAAAGIAAGVLLAMVTQGSRLCSWILSPAIRIMRTAPVASFILLVLLWVKKNYVPVVISAMMTLPIMWQDVSSGIESTDPMLLEMARVYRFSFLKKARYIYLPEVMPHLISGICTSVALAWKSGIAAEVICIPQQAIGTQIYYSKIYLETPDLFVWTAVVIVLSCCIEAVLRKILTGKAVAE